MHTASQGHADLPDATPDPDNVGEYLISSRSFAEYEAMFALSSHDFRGAVLDCPGGASSFTTMARAQGCHAVAADPVYAMPAAVLTKKVRAETARGSAHTVAGFSRYRWDFYGDPAGHREIRGAAAELFVRDYASTVGRPSRYVAAALPQLPFRRHTFDLALSSHFLFTYADRLDESFHLAALRELLRVAQEVRVFPLLDQGGRALGGLIDSLAQSLAGDGVVVRRQQVAYEFQRGGNEMLMLRAGS